MSIRRSLFVQFLNSYSGTGIAFVSVVILARLLTPQEIGVFDTLKSVAKLILIELRKR